MPISKLEVSVSDLTKRPRVQITQGDRRSRVIEATVTDGGSPMDLTGKRARFRAELPLGKVVIDDGCEVADAEAGVIRYTVGDEVAARAAVISDAYFEIYDEEGYSLAASKMVVEVGRGVDVDGERPSDYVPELDRLKAELARIAEEAESAETERASEFEVVKADAERATRAADKAAQNAEKAATKAESVATSATASIGNVLVGEASGKLAHAEDAYNGAGIRRLTVEGACKQVTTTGKNLCAGFEHGQIDTGGAETGNETTKSCRTGFIAVEGGASYVLSLVGVSASTTAKGRQYDSSKAYIGSLALYAGKVAATSASCAYLRYEFDESVSGDAAKLVEGTAHAQIEKGSSATAYEPYTGGKPSPSPEYPQGITVIENPVVKVAGRNLIDVRSDMPESDCNKDFDSSIKRIILPGTYVVGLTMNNYLSANNIEDLSIGDGSISFTGKTVGYGVGIGVDLLPGETYIDKSTRYHSYYSKDGSFIKYDEGERFTVPADARYAVANFRVEEDNSSVSAKNIAITHVFDSGAYKPHTSQTITFALHAEHPYLAKLPDGTADEIVVDQEGNVELVARVDKVVFDGSQAFYEVQNGDIETYYETSNPIGTGVLDVAQWGGLFDRFETGNPYSQHSSICAYSFANINGVVFRVRPRETFANAGAFVDWLKSNPITSYYADTEPKTYQLGKIDMPKAQDSIVNVWTEAEVTPRTGIGYVRDVNIVVANLEAAIASIS